MVMAFVRAKDDTGSPIVAEHFEFQALPRKGEEIALNDGKVEHYLEVIAVLHLTGTRSKTPSSLPQSEVHVICKQLAP